MEVEVALHFKLLTLRSGSPPQKELKAQHFTNNPSLRLHKFGQWLHVAPQLHLDSCHKVRKKATHRILETELGGRRSETIHGFLFTKLGRRGVLSPASQNQPDTILAGVEEVFLLHVSYLSLPIFNLRRFIIRITFIQIGMFF